MSRGHIDTKTANDSSIHFVRDTKCVCTILPAKGLRFIDGNCRDADSQNHPLHNMQTSNDICRDGDLNTTTKRASLDQMRQSLNECLSSYSPEIRKKCTTTTIPQRNLQEEKGDVSLMVGHNNNSTSSISCSSSKSQRSEKKRRRRKKRNNNNKSGRKTVATPPPPPLPSPPVCYFESFDSSPEDSDNEQNSASVVVLPAEKEKVPSSNSRVRNVLVAEQDCAILLPSESSIVVETPKATKRIMALPPTPGSVHSIRSIKSAPVLGRPRRRRIRTSCNDNNFRDMLQALRQDAKQAVQYRNEFVQIRESLEQGQQQQRQQQQTDAGNSRHQDPLQSLQDFVGRYSKDPTKPDGRSSVYYTNPSYRRQKLRQRQEQRSVASC